MRIQICDREEVEDGIRVVEPYLLISIRDPEKKEVRIPKTSMVIDSLRLSFDDAEPTVGLQPSCPIEMMQDWHADAIWKILEKNIGKSSLLAVHCEAGMSRSPAVGMAISESVGLPTESFTREYQPNMFVHRLVMDAFNRLSNHQQGRLVEWLSSNPN